MGSSSKQKQTASGFLKSFVHPRQKKTIQTQQEPQTTSEYKPRLPSLDFKPVNNPIERDTDLQIASKDDYLSPTRPKISHKKSASNISVKNFFSENKNRGSKIFSKEEQKLVLDMTSEGDNGDLNSNPSSPSKAKAGRDFKMLKQLHWNNNKEQTREVNESNSPFKKLPDQYKQEKNKENQAPNQSGLSMLPPLRPRPNVSKPLPPLSVNTAHTPDANDQIRLYTPKIYSASSQRNFFEYDVSLKPRPQSMAIGERKTSWTSMTSLTGRAPSVRSVRTGSIDVQRGNPTTGQATSRKTSASYVAATGSITSTRSTSSRPMLDADDNINIEDSFEALLVREKI